MKALLSLAKSFCHQLANSLLNISKTKTFEILATITHLILIAEHLVLPVFKWVFTEGYGLLASVLV